MYKKPFHIKKVFKSRIRSDKCIWQIFALLGINFTNHHYRSRTKCCRKILMTTFGVSIIYAILVHIGEMLAKRYMEGVAYILVPISSVLMWYFMYANREDISGVLLEIYCYRRKYESFKKTGYYIKPLITIILLSPYIITILGQVIVDFESENLDIWSWGIKVHSVIWKRIIVFIGNIAYFVFFIAFPLYLTFSLNMLFYRCSEVLSSYNVVLQSQLQLKVEKGVVLLKEFFDLMKTVKRLNETVMNHSFLIIFYGLEGLFSILLTLSLDDFVKGTMNYIIVVIYHVTCSTVMIVSYIFCSSMIPLNLMRIKNNVREFINKFGYDQFSNEEYMFYLQRIESEEIVYMSACELFHLRRSLLLTALGTVLTYGLLIIGFRFED